MLIISTLSLLIFTAVTLRRDMSILYNRVVITSLFYCLLQSYVTFSIISEGIGIHGGLFHITTITQIFHIFLYFISILILQLTSFPRILRKDTRRDLNWKGFSDMALDSPSIFLFHYRHIAVVIISILAIFMGVIEILSLISILQWLIILFCLLPLVYINFLF